MTPAGPQTPISLTPTSALLIRDRPTLCSRPGAKMNGSWEPGDSELPAHRPGLVDDQGLLDLERASVIT